MGEKREKKEISGNNDFTFKKVHFRKKKEILPVTALPSESSLLHLPYMQQQVVLTHFTHLGKV